MRHEKAVFQIFTEISAWFPENSGRFTKGQRSHQLISVKVNLGIRYHATIFHDAKDKKDRKVSAPPVEF